MFNVTKFSKYWNAKLPIVFIKDGIVIDAKYLQLSNACESIGPNFSSLEVDGRVCIEIKFGQLLNAYDPILSTLSGIVSDVKPMS